MARSRSRAAAATPARSSTSKATTRRAPAAAQVVEEGPGSGALDTSIAVLTAVILVAAFLFIDYERGSHYGEGAFFAKSYAENAK